MSWVDDDDGSICNHDSPLIRSDPIRCVLGRDLREERKTMVIGMKKCDLMKASILDRDLSVSLGQLLDLNVKIALFPW